MKLIYRGMTYNYNSLKASSRPVRREAPYILHYRGVNYQVVPQSETPAATVYPITYQLIYRGNTYSVTRTVAVEAVSDSNQPSELVMQTL
jgi:hypothetical protein